MSAAMLPVTSDAMSLTTSDAIVTHHVSRKSHVKCQFISHVNCHVSHTLLAISAPMSLAISSAMSMSMTLMGEHVEPFVMFIFIIDFGLGFG